MKSWTALNINEFILFDMFGSTFEKRGNVTDRECCHVVPSSQ